MKFTIAAYILAKAKTSLLPGGVGSEQPPQHQHQHQHEGILSSNEKRISSTTALQHQDSTTTINHSMGKERLAQQQRLQPQQSQTGIFNIIGTNSNRRVIKECDPSSSDPDIGILSCGMGYDCLIHPQVSTTLGGLCTSSSSSSAPRALQSQDKTCDLCGFQERISTENFDAVVDSDIPAYNGTTCGDLFTAVYVNATIDIYSCPTVAPLAQAAGCCSPVCDLCGTAAGRQIFNDDAADAVVTTTVAGLERTTCGELAEASYLYVTIANETCPAIAEAAAAVCCMDAPTYSCRICGNDGSLEEDAFVETYGVTCGYLEPFLNEEECRQFSPNLVPTCCPGGVSQGGPGWSASTGHLGLCLMAAAIFVVVGTLG
jgi:hypothetical protein